TVPGSFGWGSAVFASSAILAPSSASRLAIASPIPRLPPDINMVLSCKLVFDIDAPFIFSRKLGYILPDQSDTFRIEYFLITATTIAPSHGHRIRWRCQNE